jgi:hypothetical protein
MTILIWLRNFFVNNLEQYESAASAPENRLLFRPPSTDLAAWLPRNINESELSH